MKSLKPLKKKPELDVPCQLSPELQRVSDGVGQFIQYWGFKAIHGRIWTLLYLSSTPLSAAQVARALKVSKTLLSFSITELLEYSVIQEAGRGVKRTVYFRANPNINSVIANVLQLREKKLIEKIEESVEKLSSSLDQNRATERRALDVSRQQAQKLLELVRAARLVLSSIQWENLEPEDLAVQFMIISAALGNSGETNG